MRMSYKKGKDVKKKSKFGMLSVKAGIDKNPNPTQADRIAGAKMSDRKKANIGGLMKIKKILGGGSMNGKKRMDEAKARKQDEFRTKKMGGGMMRKTFKKGGSGKDTHVTKDGRTVKKGLYYYMNRAKKSGKSRPGKGTVTDKALKRSAKTAKKA
jgi:hypothetical protein